MGDYLDEVILNGQVQVLTDEEFMWAKLIITPPHGGKAVTYEEAIKELNDKGVTAHIDIKAVKECVYNPGRYISGRIVAEAILPVDGVDGAIEYSFEPTSKLKPTIDEETGIVNFRELGIVHNIKKGTLIATIKPNTMGTLGNDVRGCDIKCVNGVAPRYSVGAGTVLSNDQTKIYAASDGNIRWDKDKFVVDTVVTISGDVDASVGNIDFVGDVVVKGRINEGYHVKGKNISVKLNVNHAIAEASESITIGGGAVCAEIKCEKDIKMSFGENSKISCKGDLETKALIHCQVLCEGEVKCVSGKGVIIGGECVAHHNISANQIGSEGYLKTVVNLGNTAVLMQKYKELSENFKTLSANYNKLKKLYEKLTDLRSEQELTEQQEKARKQAFMFIMNERNTMEEMSSKIEETELTLSQSRQLQLTVKKRIYPGVVIKLYNALYDNQMENGASVYYLDSDNEIKFRAGSK